MSTEALTPFEEQLLASLQRRREELPETPVRARRALVRPALVALALAVALAVVAAVGAATILVVETLQDEPPIWHTVSPGAEDQRRAQSALAGARTLVLHVTVRDSGTRIGEAWYDAGRSTFAARLRRELATGVYFSLGTEQLAGRTVLRLVRPPWAYPPGGPTRVAAVMPPGTPGFLLDAKTYLPVRRLVMTPPRLGGRSLTWDYEWLPRTPENVRHLKPRRAG
jgi:hypothetical protein